MSGSSVTSAARRSCGTASPAVVLESSGSAAASARSPSRGRPKGVEVRSRRRPEAPPRPRDGCGSARSAERLRLQHQHVAPRAPAPPRGVLRLAHALVRRDRNAHVLHPPPQLRQALGTVAHGCSTYSRSYSANAWIARSASSTRPSAVRDLRMRPSGPSRVAQRPRSAPRRRRAGHSPTLAFAVRHRGKRASTPRPCPARRPGGRVHPDAVTARRPACPPHPKSMAAASQVEASGVVVVLGEGRELGPPNRPLEQHRLAHVDAAEAGSASSSATTRAVARRSTSVGACQKRACMVTVCGMSSEHEPSELDPSGVLTRSDEAGGYVSLTSVREPIRPARARGQRPGSPLVACGGGPGLGRRGDRARRRGRGPRGVRVLSMRRRSSPGSPSPSRRWPWWPAWSASRSAAVAVAIVVVIAGIFANPFLLTRILELVSP